jgi:hypothetical protein
MMAIVKELKDSIVLLLGLFDKRVEFVEFFVDLKEAIVFFHG